MAPKRHFEINWPLETYKVRKNVCFCFFHFWCPEMTVFPNGIIDFGSLYPLGSHTYWFITRCVCFTFFATVWFTTPRPILSLVFDLKQKNQLFIEQRQRNFKFNLLASAQSPFWIWRTLLYIPSFVIWLKSWHREAKRIGLELR